MLEQIDLNEEMAELGLGRYNAQVESARHYEQNARSKSGQRLMRDLLPEFNKRIAEMLKPSAGRPTRWLNDLKQYDSRKVAYITLKTVLNGIPYKKTMASMSYSVGKALENEIRCTFLVRTNERGEGIIKGAKERSAASKIRHVQLSMKHEENKRGVEDFEAWPRRDRISCGTNLIEILRASTGLIEYVYLREKGRKNPTRFVTPTAETLDWIEKFNNHRSLLDPFWMPMVEPPEDWVNVWEGGYKIEGTTLPKVPFIKTPDVKFLREVDNKSFEIPMEAANLIQRTPWEINGRVLDIVSWAWDNNIPVGTTIVSQEDEVKPPFPIDGEENERAKKEWNQMAAGVHRRNTSTRSKRVLCATIIRLAKKFRKERFWTPVNACFRGRLYSIPSFLNVQGSDLSRGLLQFERSEKVKNKKEARWLAIHGANCWGYDKVTLEEREKWAYDNAEMILRISDDPKTNTEWMDADGNGCWQFLAFCFEWSEFLREGKLKTHLPCSMDATNNGLQILSILTRCDYGCVATNVIPTERPADIYDVVRVRVEGYLGADAKNSHPFAQPWLDYGLCRKMTKKSVMCFSYGLTMYSNRQYILDWFEDKIHADSCPSPFDLREYYKAVHYLAEQVWKAVEEILDLPKRCMYWFQEVCGIVCKEERHLTWTTPSGFIVKQDYKKLKDSKVSTWITGEAIHVRFSEDTENMSPRSMKNGVSPNVVHGLDGSLLHKTVVAANKEGIWDFSMIHDSFGTHCKNSDTLARVIREQAVEMFTPDLLREWLNQIKKQNPDLEFPDPPEYGEADISLLKDSLYFFS
jgi:DNA-directed RNA polymerase